MEPTGFAQRNAGIIMDKLDKCNQLIETCISISPDARLTRRLEELEDEVDDIATQAEMLSNGDEQIQSSKKPIKSGYNGLDEEVADLQIDMTNTGYFEDGWLLLNVVGDGPYNVNGYPDGTEFTINAYGPNGEDLGSKKFDFLDLWHNGKPVNSSIQSSMQGQERGIQAIMDEYGCSREEAIDIMNSEVTSGCHGKAKKKAKKEIKSTWSVEDETDYWTEDDEERLRAEYAEENGLDLNEDIIDEDDYNEWIHRGAAMYSSVNRNHKNVQALYN